MRPRLPIPWTPIVLIAILGLGGCGGDRVADPAPSDDTTGGTGGTGTVDQELAVFADDFALDLAGTDVNPTTTTRAGFRGITYAGGGFPSGRVADVRLLFLSEDGRRAFAVRSDADGEYAVVLRPDRYHVYALADGFEPYSTCCGYFVFPGGDWQVGNVALQREGPVCSADGTYAGRAGYDPARYDDRAPTATIRADREVVRVGEPVTLRISGEDDHALAALWWGSLLGCEPECGRAQFVACNGAAAGSTEVEVSFRRPGRHVLFANARDDAYPNGLPHQASEGLGMGCVEIIVTR